MSRGYSWSAEESAIVRENPDLTCKVLADKIGRSESGVRNERLRQKKAAGESTRKYVKGLATWEFDERPSGWYGEKIGLLLVEYQEAFEAWKHYHRYVEVLYVGQEMAGFGWVSLWCRRDASAP